MQIRRFAMKSRAPAFILVSDLDHTMVQNEDPEHHSLLNFNRLWCRSGLAIDSMLVFSTGRSPTLYRELWVRVIVCLFCTHVLHEWLDSCVSLFAGTGTHQSPTTQQGKTPLLTAHAVICSVGTEIFHLEEGHVPPLIGSKGSVDQVEAGTTELPNKGKVVDCTFGGETGDRESLKLRCGGVEVPGHWAVPLAWVL